MAKRWKFTAIGSFGQQFQAIGGGTPRDFEPDGDVLDRNGPCSGA
jgi:hypothetical protein